MGKKLIVLSISFLLLVLTSEILAVETVSKPTKDAAEKFYWNNKLQRGFLNIITSPVELVRQFHIAVSKDASSTRRIFFVLTGVGKVCLRLGAGVVELLTFPFDFPAPGKTPLVEPEYIWES